LTTDTKGRRTSSRSSSSRGSSSRGSRRWRSGGRNRECLEVVDRPVRLRKCARVILDIGTAGARAARLGKDVTGPVTAESVVKHDLLGSEVRGRAVSGGEVRICNGPSARVGSVVGEIGWNGVTAEEPDLDA